jgi:REP element-mobilizing transposase RayT
MPEDVVRLDEPQRQTVARAIAEVCEHRAWRLHALNVRTNHVHAVVTSEAPIDRVLNTFKAYSTRELRKSGLVSSGTRTWARHGSTRFLRDEQDVIGAVSYVLDYQGDDLGGTIAPGE